MVLWIEGQFVENSINDGLQVFRLKSCFEVDLFECLDVCGIVRFGKSLLCDEMNSGLKW